MIINWAALLARPSLLVGLLNVVGSHLRRVLSRSSDWVYSLVLLLAMLLTIVLQLSGRRAAATRCSLPAWSNSQSVIFHAVYEPLAAFLALLAFFSLSAALRALRRRTADALVVIVAALVLVISALPQLAALPVLGSSMSWVSDYVALAGGARGLLIGAALGAVVAGVRVLLGFDQPYLDR